MDTLPNLGSLITEDGECTTKLPYPVKQRAGDWGFKVYEINSFYAETFSFFISHDHVTPMSHKGSKCRQWQLVQ